MTADRAAAAGPEFADARRLRGVVRAALGPGRRIVTASRLVNGSKKGVYRLVLDDHETVIVYVWNTAEDYWHSVTPEGAGDPADPFSHASGLDLFEAASRRLESVGVRSPRLLFVDRSRTLYPGDIAVVEDVAELSLAQLLDRDPVAADLMMERFGELIDILHGYQGPAFGKVAVVDGGGVSVGTSCEQVVLDRALAELAEIAAADPRAAAARPALEDKLRELAAEVRPRARFVLVHGELGPDHVFVGEDGEPVLIDIEGLMYFDAEWEHVFLRMRFGANYGHLERDGLDDDRLRLYRLAMHVDLVAGPRRMAASDHPARDWFRELADEHLQRALELVG